jgi:hypothetical protein
MAIKSERDTKDHQGRLPFRERALSNCHCRGGPTAGVVDHWKKIEASIRERGPGTPTFSCIEAILPGMCAHGKPA